MAKRKTKRKAGRPPIGEDTKLVQARVPKEIWEELQRRQAENRKKGHFTTESEFVRRAMAKYFLEK